MSLQQNSDPQSNEKPMEVEPGSSYDAVMKLLKWADEIPEETWAGVPDDASKQYKHYLYGTPRVPD